MIKVIHRNPVYCTGLCSHCKCKSIRMFLFRSVLCNNVLVLQFISLFSDLWWHVVSLSSKLESSPGCVDFSLNKDRSMKIKIFM